MRGLWLLALVLLAGCQHVAVPPVGGEIRDLRSGETLTAQQLLVRLAEPERLIIGEQHDNADHHAAQLWLLQALGEQRTQGSLLLEMLTANQQAKVDAARQAKYAPADLPAALAWQEGWDWNLYGPIVRFALTQPYPLLAANLDDSEIRAFYRNPPALNGPRSNALSVKKTLLGQISESHCGLLPESQMPAMLTIQQQRDRRMAERMLAAPTPAILLAGAWHARKDVGVPLHLLDLGAAEAPTVLMLAEQGDAVTAAMADYVWYTPATPKPDYCEQMRQQFAK
ncbi:iron(III) ABC transporter [Pseudomonas koreensis]|uniref:Iron(III) ABC transporter n=2 Tax=Pseudomonas TaxID=286 RepID=A0A4Q4KX32_9PSED|nr:MULTISPECIES: ChaN family lipoprotein [Pseudomonas]MDM8193109.1 ChaN family lipoprotein [Pseudomonas fluorescens]MDP8574354.1 ChaN family lipoprotein [Pseudomonas iranensis]MDR7055891.1 putative iron-regulated protein [Pseudomonas koreensis]RYM38726.1 iron(III) ABC transporter [Pseudomonas koreensis]